MKSYRSILSGLVMLSLLIALPVWAEMAAVSDSEMAGITGKAATNTYTFSSGAFTRQTASSDTSANIQVGWYQWSDNHATDQSNQKAANDFDSSGGSNQAQYQVTAAINAINWGATGNGEIVAGDLAATDFTNMDYAVMAVGGF